jgi:F0F1-type ATP synthase assembly protein I
VWPCQRLLDELAPRLKRNGAGVGQENMPELKTTQLGDLLTIGIMFPACIGIGYGIGYVLDLWIGTKSVFKISFLILGIAAGFVNLFRMVGQLDDHDQSS